MINDPYPDERILVVGGSPSGFDISEIRRLSIAMEITLVHVEKPMAFTFTPPMPTIPIAEAFKIFGERREPQWKRPFDRPRKINGRSRR